MPSPTHSSSWITFRQVFRPALPSARQDFLHLPGQARIFYFHQVDQPTDGGKWSPQIMCSPVYEFIQFVAAGFQQGCESGLVSSTGCDADDRDTIDVGNQLQVKPRQFAEHRRVVLPFSETDKLSKNPFDNSDLNHSLKAAVLGNFLHPLRHSVPYAYIPMSARPDH